MRPLARWCVRHRRIVVLCWLAILAIVSGVAHAAGTRYSNNFNLPKTQSTDAIHLLQAVLPQASGDMERVVVATTAPSKVTDPAVVTRVNQMLARIEKFPHVTNVLSPYEPAGSDQISQDGTVAFATVTFDQQPQNLDKLAQAFVNTARSANGDGLQVGVSGQLGEQSNKPALNGTGLGILLAGVVLLLVFGSLFAMALPLLSALVSLGTAIGLIGLLSHVMRMPQFSDQLVLLIGLGVGVDYALFIVTRHRQGLLAGRDVETSIIDAVNTSGRAVMFAGIIVCIALLGMFALGVSFLYGMAVSAAIGVALTMIAALTLLPALLGFIGPKVMSRRQKRSLALNGPRVVGTGTKGFWVRWAAMVRRRPALPALVALGLVVVVALPFFSMRLGSSDQGNDPVGTTTRTAYDLLARGFGPGFNGPLQIVSVLHAPGDRAALERELSGIKDQPGVAGISRPFVVPGREGTQVALLEVYPRSAPQDVATTTLITQLRNHVLPKALAGSSITAYVGGRTAIFVDFAHVLSSKLALFITAVVVLSFLLLAVVFRSLVIPLISAAMNMLSIGAAFGVVTAAFGWGWAGSIIGVNRPGPVEAFLPVMLFAILFGLSMDYQVFLVTRMHEERLRTGSNAEAVQRGLAATGKTITAAALIMILVFGSFILGGQLVIKEFGLGLAAGILIDSVMIRMAIVPAVMLLTREANWWFPQFLNRLLPHIGFEVPHVEGGSGEGSAERGPGELVSR